MKKIKVEVAPDANGEIVDIEEMIPKMTAAGWSDDPGTGKAVLLPDERGAPGREVLNPLPFAPPIGFEPTPPLEELIRDRVRREVASLRDDEEIDDILDAEDFEVDDELPPLETIYEVVAMKPEAPKMERLPEPSLEDRVKAEVEYEELKDRERLLRKRHRRAALERAKQELVELGEDDGQEVQPG